MLLLDKQLRQVKEIGYEALCIKTTKFLFPRKLAVCSSSDPSMSPHARTHTHTKNRSLGCGSKEGKYFWSFGIILRQNGQPCEALSLLSLQMSQQRLEVPSPTVVPKKFLNPPWLVCSEINANLGFQLHYCTNTGPTCNQVEFRASV